MERIKIKILFIGCVESSRILLDTLINYGSDKVEIVGVITKDQSNYNSDFYDISNICRENNIDYIYSSDINDRGTIDYISSKKPDLIYCFGWSQLLGEEIISIPSKGVVGFHPTKLPQNRGRHPIIWTLVLGLEETASTFFIIDKTADTGDIISQEVIKVSEKDTANSLYNKILEVASKQLIYITDSFLWNNINRVPQKSQISNSWRKRTVEDGKIDWRMSSKNIYNLVRALTKPYVGAHFIYKGKQYKVWKVEIFEGYTMDNVEYGKVIRVNDDRTIIIKTGDGAVKLIEYDHVDLKEGEYLI